MLTAEESVWIANRRLIWAIMLRVKRNQISVIEGEKQIRQILYGKMVKN